MLKDTSHPYYELIKLGAEQARSRLVNNPHPIPTDSQIKIKPIDADPNRNGPEDLFTPIDWLIGGHEGIIRNFRDKPKKWVQFIEDAVNAMSQVKGIPQSGTLALLPPSEIPQS